LRSLIPTGTLSQSEGLIQEVPLEHLSPSPFQPRAEVEDQSLEELVESVKVHGILQPLVARRDGAALQLIAGERRLQAAKLAGLHRVPVVIRQATDQEMLELALVENLQREDINPMEAADAYRRLMTEFGLTQEQVAGRVGKSRPAVANSIRLLNLPEPIRESLRRAEIDEGHGKVLAGIPDGRTVLRLWRRVVRRGMSVKQTAAAAAKLLGRDVPRGTSPAAEVLDPNLQELQDRLTAKLGARVRLRARGSAGTIEIPYADAEDLDRVFSAIMG
jgi:ParB family chromosome partitioning protein